MLGKLIGGFFGLLGALWDGFWNVSGKLLRLLVFTVLCGIAAVAVLKLSDSASSEAWLYFKGGAFIGLLIGAVRLLINEIAVPLVHDQTQRARQQARKDLEIQIARSRAAANQESVSNRLKHLN